MGLPAAPGVSWVAAEREAAVARGGYGPSSFGDDALDGGGGDDDDDEASSTSDDDATASATSYACSAEAPAARRHKGRLGGAIVDRPAGERRLSDNAAVMWGHAATA